LRARKESGGKRGGGRTVRVCSMRRRQEDGERSDRRSGRERRRSRGQGARAEKGEGKGAPKKSRSSGSLPCSPSSTSHTVPHPLLPPLHRPGGRSHQAPKVRRCGSCMSRFRAGWRRWRRRSRRGTRRGSRRYQGRERGRRSERVRVRKEEG
jgi:hypothetical protein